jgi:RNA polymerase sigma-70 factor, ECF subfamily
MCRTVIRLLFFNCNRALSHLYSWFPKTQGNAPIASQPNDIIATNSCNTILDGIALSLITIRQQARLCKGWKILASDSELSDFLKNVEKKAFKRAFYHVRDEDAALDILQDSMIKLCTNYSDKPLAELPLLFQRILSNTVLDWFRRQKTKNALFSNLSDFDSDDGDGDFDLLEVNASASHGSAAEGAEEWIGRLQTLEHIESAIMTLPARQREAFLLRYWEELDVAETAAVMGCSEGSVKTHCSRAIQALSQTLENQGLRP